MSEVCAVRCHECPVWLALDDEVQVIQVDAGLLLEVSKEETVTENAVQLYLDVADDDYMTDEEREIILEMGDDYSPESAAAFGRLCVALADELINEAITLESDIEDMLEPCESGPIQIPAANPDGSVSADFRCMSYPTLNGQIKYFDEQQITPVIDSLG